MKIKSNVAEASKYSDDALEAFYTAVENGQARLALMILVDVIQTFEEKIDALEGKTTEHIPQPTLNIPEPVQAEPAATNVADKEQSEIKPSDVKSKPKAKDSTQSE